MTKLIFAVSYVSLNNGPYSARQHPSYGDCLEVKRKYYQNSSVLDCVTQCSQSAAHLCEQFLYRSNRMGLSHWDPRAVHRGGCLELYYCNLVEWFWWDLSLISTTNWFPSVLWLCWFGHLALKIVPEVTYVSSGTLKHTHSLIIKRQFFYILSRRPIRVCWPCNIVNKTTKLKAKTKTKTKT